MASNNFYIIVQVHWVTITYFLRGSLTALNSNDVFLYYIVLPQRVIEKTLDQVPR